MCMHTLASGVSRTQSGVNCDTFSQPMRAARIVTRTRANIAAHVRAKCCVLISVINIEISRLGKLDWNAGVLAVCNGWHIEFAPRIDTPVLLI